MSSKQVSSLNFSLFVWKTESFLDWIQSWPSHLCCDTPLHRSCWARRPASPVWVDHELDWHVARWASRSSPRRAGLDYPPLEQITNRLPIVSYDRDHGDDRTLTFSPWIGLLNSAIYWCFCSMLLPSSLGLWKVLRRIPWARNLMGKTGSCP
jgi:hypothetical protein